MDVEEYLKYQAKGGRKIPPGYKGHVPGTRTHTFGRTYGHSVDAADTLRSTIRTGKLSDEGKPSKPLVQDRVLRDYPVAPRIPGYAGYIPASRNHVYGCTYAESCRRGAIAENTLLAKENPSMLVECVDDRPLVVTKPDHLAVAGSGKLKPTEIREETREFQTLKKANEFKWGQPMKEELPPVAGDTTGNLPGYGGYQAASQHIYSQTYGNATRMLNSTSSIGERPTRFANFEADRPLVERHLQGPPPAGYTGCIPGMRNHVIAQTFSRGMVSAGTAHRAVLDRTNTRSWAVPDEMPGLGDTRPHGLYHTIKARTMSFDNSVSSPSMGCTSRTSGRIPGYTGHLPGLQHTFGSTYGNMSTRRQLLG